MIKILPRPFFIGIDFSINSPGICIIKDSEPFWISRSVNPKSKAEQRFTEQLITCKDVDYLNFESSNTEHDNIDSYSNNEYQKIIRYIDRADFIATSIQDCLRSLTYIRGVDNLHFAFEGFSYGSNTNNIIDIAIATGFLKEKLIQTYDKMTLDVMAPGTIKKQAGSGRYKKKEMYEVFVENRHGDPSLVKSEFWTLCQDQRGNNKLLKPTDDLIDAYFIAWSLQAKYSERESLGINQSEKELSKSSKRSRGLSRLKV